MKQLSRRTAIGLTTAASTLALITKPPQASEQTAEEDGYDAQAERAYVMKCGMTAEEADCWIAVADAAAKFFELEELHPMDDQEVAQAIHVIQNKLLSRPTYRRYRALPRMEK